METRKIYGSGHKESVYSNAIAELLDKNNIKYKKECNIDIISPITGRKIGTYRPDFLIEDKIILEVKAVDVIPKNFIDQIYSYLRVSKYELGIFVNFRSYKLYIKRILYTNDRKNK